MEKREKSAKTTSYANLKKRALRLLKKCKDAKPPFEGIGGGLHADFLDEGRCRALILGQLHPRGASCPKCGAALAEGTATSNFWQGRPCACGGCGFRFTALTSTIFRGAHMNFKEIALLISLLKIHEEGLTLDKIAAMCGVSEGTVRRWQKKINRRGA